MTMHEVQHEHSDVTGGWLRPAVFGASDGLVSNFALIAGVAAGSSGSKIVVLAGTAGLAAGAFSMAAGEYISVRSQSEQAMAEIETERNEIAKRPLAEERELAGMYVEKGLDPALAREVARQLSRDPAVALDVHVREELGLDLGRAAVRDAGGRLVVRLVRHRRLPAPAALPARRRTACGRRWCSPWWACSSAGRSSRA